MKHSTFYFGALAQAALLCLFAILLAMPVAAQTCSTANRFVLNWNNYADEVLNPNVARVFNLTNSAGETLTVTLTFAGDIADLVPLNGTNTPNIGVYNTGGVPGQKSLTIGSIFDNRHENIAGNNDVMVVNFAFSRPVKDIAMTVVDVDYTVNQYRDWVRLIGLRNGSQLIPALTTPSANNVVYVDQTGNTAGVGVNDAVGNGSSNTAQDRGNVVGTWNVPVDAVQLRYANGPARYSGGPIGQQGIGISVTNFCSMPNVKVQKTVRPAAASGADSFSIPGNDMIYTLRVSNTGSIATDDSAVTLTDLLPENISMFTGNFAGSGGPVEFVDNGSGLTCCNTVSSFGTGSPVSFGYAPNGSYDSAVTGLRVSPSGAIPAYSSFEVNFLVKIE